MNPLFAVRDLLRHHGVASSAQLAAELSLPRAVVDDVLAHWSRRGYAQPVSSGGGACGAGCGGGCGGCPSAPPVQLYRWHGQSLSQVAVVAAHGCRAAGDSSAGY